MAERMVILVSSDDKQFEVARDVIKQSNTVNTLITDLGMDDESSSVPIPLPKVSADILTLVINWCEQHKNDPAFKEEDIAEKSDFKVPDADQKMLTGLSQYTLFHVTLAASYLDIKMLLEYCCKTISDSLKGKKAEEIRKIFNIESDFTPEEEEQIRQENTWCENKD
ncbi:hypothetical protein PMAYCL1PPCAC_26607, partial [Pristionchus mayeri]